MPGKVKVRVVAGRGLPVMDRSADTTDAFAEVIVVVNLEFPKKERKCRHAPHVGEAWGHYLQD